MSAQTPKRPMPPLPRPSWVETYQPPERGPHGPRPAAFVALKCDGIAGDDEHEPRDRDDDTDESEAA